ncbi:hypothetical protein PF004_g20741 [Phytophthora fragariae]|uniref:Uncharacterized protein n=1 Tax=Phytophthora fragariae TaxID=53985 RepID=A0A6G0N5Z1_9STRA|nr:hypothetical protein PF004_g20741 [Phytophthora fragariae]
MRHKVQIQNKPTKIYHIMHVVGELVMIFTPSSFVLHFLRQRQLQVPDTRPGQGIFGGERGPRGGGRAELDAETAKDLSVVGAVAIPREGVFWDPEATTNVNSDAKDSKEDDGLRSQENHWSAEEKQVENEQDQEDSNSSGKNEDLNNSEKDVSVLHSPSTPHQYLTRPTTRRSSLKWRDFRNTPTTSVSAGSFAKVSDLLRLCRGDRGV